MAQVIQMTTDQLKQLIEQLNANAAATAAAPGSDTAVVPKSKGSFSNITLRFGGQRDHEAVEEFITNVVTYKEIEMISDEDALKGVSLLFYGIASTWWQGVRKEAKTWNDAISLIRSHFSPAKPSYQIYMDIFEKKQDNSTAIDTFVCQKRALLAQLPDGRHDEETELDFVYGLLNIKYRKHISRHDIRTFRDLLEKGRIIEHNNMEHEAAIQGPQRGANATKRYAYYSVHGQANNKYRKRNATSTNEAVQRKRFLSSHPQSNIMNPPLPASHVNQ